MAGERAEAAGRLSAALCGALLLAAAAAAQGSGSVEREWRVRRWALAPTEEGEAILAALLSEDWTERDAGLDALRRAFDVGSLGESHAMTAELEVVVAAMLADGGSPALPRALDALAAWPREVPLPAGAVRRIGAHPNPAVRLALVRLLAHRGVRLPAELLEDPDDRVGHLARLATLTTVRLPAGAVGQVERLELLERAAIPDRVLRAWSEGGDREVLRLRAHGRGDLAAVAERWASVEQTSDRGVYLRAARAARARGLGLGPLLLERAARADEGPERAWLMEGVVATSDPLELLERVGRDPAFDMALRIELWELLLGEYVAWEPAVVHPWLDPALPAELRAQVVSTLSAAAVGGAPVGELLAVALSDPEPDIAGEAFRALANAPVAEEWFGELHRAWRARPRPDQLRLLDRLPRDPTPAPFHADLVTLAAEDAGARPVVLELLAEVSGQPPLAPQIERWLDEEVRRMLSLPASERRPVELRCTGIARSLARVGREDAVPPLVRTLSLVTGESDEVGKVLLMLLGEREQGRAAIGPWLEPEVPSRLRIEAALQLAREGGPRPVGVLAQTYATCDWELRARALRALAGLQDETSFELLRRVALDPAEDYLHRSIAVAGVARRGGGEREVLLLAEVLEGARDPEVVRSAIGALGRLGGAEATELLRARLRRVEALPLEDRTGAVVELARDEREALLPALAAALAGADAELTAAWLRLPLSSARADLAARFEGRVLANTSFRWSGELNLAAVEAQVGDLGAALARADGWWRLDARLLAALAGVAEEPEVRLQLQRAALIGLWGEGETQDRAGLALELQRELLAAAETTRDWETFARVGARVLASWREGRTSRRDWTRVWRAEFRPERGEDPEARLVSSITHARAWAALDAGEVDRARMLAGAARGQLGFSSAAREAQDRLDTAVAEEAGR